MGLRLISNGAEHAGWRRDAGLLAPRATLGATMLVHGIEKLRAPGPTAKSFEAMGIRPAGFWARATAITEAGAGLLALLGVLVRPAALAVLVTQAVAIKKVHAPKGFMTYKGGYEFNLGLMATALALLVGGAGRFSLARLLDRSAAPRGWRRWALWRRPGALRAVLHAVG